ncbi:MAG TPA: DUF6249 domain-containing protein [Rhizomicrobium sp.]|jgi:hypothetical protein|nr:DUF6249 domain-containing protein [Rhizomicrobium sp.]
MAPEFFIPFVVMLAPVAAILILLRYRYLQTQARYQMLLQLADKNVTLPPELLADPHVAHSDLRRALVLISSGLGLSALFLALPLQLASGQNVSSLWGLGLLPLMTGFGYLASWWLNRRGDM